MDAPPTNSAGDPAPKTPERLRGKNSYAEIAGGGKRVHPPAPATAAQQNSRNDDDGSKATSPFQSPNAKIQKRESNELVSSRSNSTNAAAKREQTGLNQSSDSNRSSSYRHPSRRGKSGPKEKETDPKRLAARQKQIDFGKNTVGYARYTAEVPRHMRTQAHPWTPDRDQICSKRSWDGQVRKWRRALHEYDPPGTKYVDDENGDNGAAGEDDLQPDEGLLGDDSRPPSASASASNLGENGSTNLKSSGGPQRKLMWSDVAEDDEVEMQEMQPPPSH